jgi:hypothetical protein
MIVTTLVLSLPLHSRTPLPLQFQLVQIEPNIHPVLATRNDAVEPGGGVRSITASVHVPAVVVEQK